MSSALKKAMVYLGLADGDENEELRERRPGTDQGRADQARAEPSRADRDGSEPGRTERSAPDTDQQPVTARREAGPRTETGPRTEVGAASGERRAAASTSSGSSSARVADDATARPRAERSGPRSEETAEGEYRAPVTPIKRAAASASEGAPVRTLTTVHPRSYNDAKSIGEAFRSGMPVIMNVTELGDNEAKRLVDFSAGLVFGLNGSITRITAKVFLLTPSTVEVMGDGAAGEGDAATVFAQD
ncbi:MAG: cell division protein SepF [Micrococcus sp.]|nr:cell division protein SepF [Micrococcus sp.]